jgi:N-methylhydantoinase B
VAWIALAAHMMDMGGMVPGSSAAEATECYQEALRLPPVRLIERHEESVDVWNIIRTNIRSADLIEMDIRSLVIGSAVAEGKIIELLSDMGLAAFEAGTRALLAGAERVLQDRIRAIEDGHYRSTAWIEYGDDVLRMSCDLAVSDHRLLFDLRDAPAQVPHFFNSKDYIIRAHVAMRVRQIVAPGLPFNQALYDVVEIASRKGTIVDCVMPAPIGAAHTDAAIAISAAAGQCLQYAVYASPRAAGREFFTAPALAAYGTGRWTYVEESGQRRVYTLIDGAFSGSPAAEDRDGIDLNSSLIRSGGGLEYADVEILEAAYPILFGERTIATGIHGYGKFRSGAGCREAFRPHGTNSLVGNMTGTRAWFPTGGGAGGLPGATVRFAVRHQGGDVEPVGVHAVGVTLSPGDTFEMQCATGGGFGDPLERDPANVLQDVKEGRLDLLIAEDVYGLAIFADGELDVSATDARRKALRSERLRHARPARCPVTCADAELKSLEDLPLYPGVVQRGELAISECSGAVLALAPGNWLDGCPMLETSIDSRAGGVIARAHLDPRTGRMLYVDVLCEGDRPGMDTLPERWVNAAALASSQVA